MNPDVPVRIVVVDDQEVVRAGFAALLDTQADFTVVGTASDGAEALQVCHDRHPDVVLMDVRMPTMDGIEATARLTAEASDGQVPVPASSSSPRSTSTSTSTTRSAPGRAASCSRT